MMLRQALSLRIILCMYFQLCAQNRAAATNNTDWEIGVSISDEQAREGVSLYDFNKLLFSELLHELKSPQDHVQGKSSILGRDLQANERKWDNVISHGWELSRTLKLDDGQLISMTSPYLVCSHSDIRKSAYQRIPPMLKKTQSHQEDLEIVRNDPHRTCFHVSMEHGVATSLQQDPTKTSFNEKEADRYTVVPMVDLMKVQVDTFKSVSEDSWIVPSQNSESSIENDDRDNDWQRVVSVAFSAGHRLHSTSDSVQDMANKIIDDVRSASQIGAQQRRRQRRRRNLQAAISTRSEAYGDSHASLSLSEMFSMTQADANQNYKPDRTLLRNQSKVNPSQQNQWIRSLELGLEADHGCQTMFNTLVITPHYNNQGFDIVLNPKEQNRTINHNDGIECERAEVHQTNKNTLVKQCKNGIECTASNKHCVISLIMGLSTHPMVISIESEDGPISSNDYESQWITQTKVVGRRPLSNIGINGKNQIISVLDSGLDINHKYFGPTDPKVFDQWDHSQRKVVRYDHSVGDKTESTGGHGTKVAGAAAGRAINNYNDKANGIARDAKLHVFDIMQGSGGLRMPADLAYRLFESMHSTDKRPARVAVGSFNTRYRPYPFSCKFFDEALHGKFSGDLYVASAGNEGLDSKSKQSMPKTIGNPASCKNTLAVGASQSHGGRLYPGLKGLDYVAGFSSRGPTYDGRMSPDLVAPGASVLTAKAHGNTVKVYGTSFSAPTVAGNAALVRQYFEEGKLPCDQVDCSLDPSGSLVKAVLMNSARSLKQVQVSRPWIGSQELEEVSEYDDNQGMGLIQLNNTLPISKHNKINAIVRNNEEINDGQFHDIYIKATPNKCRGTSYIDDLSVTLAWYDLAGSASCAKCLVNDLDIMVHEVRANLTVKGGTKKFPNGLSHKDYDNNVERIRFKMSNSRRYRIRIKASNLATARTRFSMIASGCFKEVVKDTIVS